MLPQPRSAPRVRSRGAFLTLAIALVASVAGALFWFLSGDAPGAVDLPAGSPAAVGSGSASAVAGTWTVDPSVGSFDDFSGSFVGYRVSEELSGVGAVVAVGRTPDVTGSLTIEGTRLMAASFEADLTTLRSDRSMRDRQLARQGLETARFPTARFALAEPVELGRIPGDGRTLEIPATGDLTLHGTTRRVTIPLRASLDGEVVTVVGSLGIRFGDFGMTAPSAPIVLSVADPATLELQLRLTRS